jgi:protein-tyrosine kinase
MGKTFEALQQAEEESRTRDVITGSNGRYPGELKTTPQTVIEHHRMKHNILRLNGASKVKLLMFAACKSGEGTTSVLTGFAYSLARDGERVLLVDANLRRPGLHKVFGLAGECGLTELIHDNLKLREVIKETGNPKLSVITCGSPHPNPYTILGSQEMKSQVEIMKSQADWLLFDSSPIASYNDAAALAGNVDSVILVAESEKTRWEVAASALKSLQSGNAKVLGVVLNKRRYPIPNWLYTRL